MAKWRFEVANWHDEDARTKATALRDAQAEAMGLTLSPQELGAFEAMADTVDNMLTALSVPSNATVYINAQADSRETGFSMNLGFDVTYPQSE